MGGGGRSDSVVVAEEMGLSCLRRRRESCFGVRLGRVVGGGIRVMGVEGGDAVGVVNVSGDGRGGKDRVVVRVVDRRLRGWVSIGKVRMYRILDLFRCQVHDRLMMLEIM